MLFQNYYRKKNYSHLKIYSIVFFLIILLGWCWFLIVQKKKTEEKKFVFQKIVFYNSLK